MKYVIVGGVAGGASFACRLRRLSEEAEIVIYEKSHFVSYANCGLPYYVSSTIEEPRKLTLQTPESLKARFNIDVHVDNEVLSIDRERHVVLVKDLKTGKTFEDSYDELILSPGAEAIHLAPLGKRIYQLKTVEDSLRLRSDIEREGIESAIVIGGGFIGLEIAENLSEAGLHVVLLEGRDHVLNTLDSEMAAFVQKELRLHDIELVLSTKVEEIEETEDHVEVRTDRKGIVECQILIQAVGVLPSSKLAQDCQLDLDIRKTIRTDSDFTTSDKNIHALGDAIALDSALDGSRVNIALAGLANKEGRELANHLVLGKEVHLQPIGTSILKVFSLSVGSTGFTESQLRQKGVSFDKLYLSPSDHATYYPGSSTMVIKVLFSPETRHLLGAQIVGKNGVDKRIDVLATAIHFDAKVEDLQFLELSYAPPFSSAKDPINLIGQMAENLKEGLVKQFFFDEVDELRKNPDVLFVDVRTPMEYRLGHIEGSFNIPVDELRKRYGELPKDKEIALICESALRSYVAYRFLAQKGYSCRHLAGGYRIYATWKEEEEKNRQ